MARKLHDQYGFSYDNLKVLLGGWNTWKEFNAKDPNAYPIEVTPGSTPGSGGPNVIVITPPAGTVGNPAPTQSP